MNSQSFGIGFAILCVLQGCTHLNAAKVDDGKLRVEGVPYNLTFTQYDLTIKRRLAGCSDHKGEPDMMIATTVEATRKEARDPSREYVIDFSTLRSFFKSTDVSVEYYDNGALKSVNAAVQDATSEFLKSSFSLAARIAMLGTGTGAKADACTKEVDEMVRASAMSEKAIATKNAALVRQIERLERMVSVATALGPTRSSAERRAFADEVEALYDARAAVEDEQRKLAGYLKKLTITTKVTWPTNGTTFSGQLIAPLESKDIKMWGSLSDEGLPKLKSATGVWALFTSDSPLVKHVICKNEPCGEAATASGLKYRFAMPGTFKACSAADCKGDDSVLFQDTGLFSQLGPIMTLPLRNYPFMNQTIVLTMNEAGQPTKVGYVSQASAEKAIDTFSTYVDEYGKVRQARKPKSELDLVEEETALLEAKAKLASARAALDLNPNATQAATTAALKADTALLEAELAKIKAQATLDDALRQLAL